MMSFCLHDSHFIYPNSIMYLSTYRCLKIHVLVIFYHCVSIDYPMAVRSDFCIFNKYDYVNLTLFI